MNSEYIRVASAKADDAVYRAEVTANHSKALDNKTPTVPLTTSSRPEALLTL